MLEPVDPANAQPSAVEAVLPDPRVALLNFLVGRWSGNAPDGTTFYDQYDFPNATTLRSRRFTDATFTSSSDGSTVSLEGNEIISRWGEFSWRAGEVRDGYAVFEPINAPSRFSWRRVDADTVEVEQRWNDANGQPQSYKLTLRRVP